MVIDNQLKTRVLRSLRWLVREAQWRFMQAKEGTDKGSGVEYSPELKEAIHLLEDLEQSNFAFSEGSDFVGGWSEQECRETAVLLGYGEEFGSEFFVLYKSQNWCWGGGAPMSDLNACLRRFRLMNRTKVPEVLRSKEGKTPRQQWFESQEKH